MSRKYVMGTRELAEDGFLTEFHDHAMAEAIWVVKKYEPANWVVEFYKIEAGEKVGVVRVGCRALAGGLTGVELR